MVMYIQFQYFLLVGYISCKESIVIVMHACICMSEHDNVWAVLMIVRSIGKYVIISCHKNFKHLRKIGQWVWYLHNFLTIFNHLYSKYWSVILAYRRTHTYKITTYFLPSFAVIGEIEPIFASQINNTKLALNQENREIPI